VGVPASTSGATLMLSDGLQRVLDLSGPWAMDRKEYNRRAVATFRRQRRGQDPPSHGRNGYDNYGCRCRVCVEANRAKSA